MKISLRFTPNNGRAGGSSSLSLRACGFGGDVAPLTDATSVERISSVGSRCSSNPRIAPLETRPPRRRSYGPYLAVDALSVSLSPSFCGAAWSSPTQSPPQCVLLAVVTLHTVHMQRAAAAPPAPPRAPASCEPQGGGPPAPAQERFDPAAARAPTQSHMGHNCSQVARRAPPGDLARRPAGRRGRQIALA